MLVTLHRQISLGTKNIVKGKVVKFITTFAFLITLLKINEKASHTGRKYLQIMSDKRLVPRIYKELL